MYTYTRRERERERLTQSHPLTHPHISTGGDGKKACAPFNFNRQKEGVHLIYPNPSLSLCICIGYACVRLTYCNRSISRSLLTLPSSHPQFLLFLSMKNMYKCTYMCMYVYGNNPQIRTGKPC